tara:strand:- start:9 stop:560 length:552 start_codon:yes stop_codon:yes gene_type:complete
MVLLESLSLDLGHKMPDFTLDDPFGYSYNNHDLMGDKGLLIIFTCNHCPYAIAIWNRLIESRKSYVDLGVHMVAINPNINPDYPDDSPEAMKAKIKNDRIPFPYLVDLDQAVAKAYQAQCTPDLYLVKPDMTLYYHGRLDDNWKDETAVTNQELLESAKRLSQNQNPPETQYPAMGCSIKWLE